jgi:predicted HicB family RNase H-like nuclease
MAGCRGVAYPIVRDDSKSQISIRPERALREKLAAEASEMRRSINQHVLAILEKHFAEAPK